MRMPEPGASDDTGNHPARGSLVESPGACRTSIYDGAVALAAIFEGTSGRLGLFLPAKECRQFHPNRRKVL